MGVDELGDIGGRGGRDLIAHRLQRPAGAATAWFRRSSSAPDLIAVDRGLGGGAQAVTRDEGGTDGHGAGRGYADALKGDGHSASPKRSRSGSRGRRARPPRPRRGIDHDAAAPAGRQHHHPHDALAVDPLAVALQLDAAREATGAAHQLGRGPGVEPQAVGDLDLRRAMVPQASSGRAPHLSTPSRPPSRALSTSWSRSRTA
jgi:hypothetical protein